MSWRTRNLRRQEKGTDVDDTRWFAAKTIYRWPSISGVTARNETMYEERITLIRATDLDDALAQGEALAKQYARQLDGAEYLGFIDVFEISDAIGAGAEVYSRTRSSPLPPHAFLDRYYDDATSPKRDPS